jgi:diadenylate cyclase
MENAIAQTVLACTDMSESHTGALIIFERDVDLGSIVNTGTLINADVTAELLKNLFYNKAPLHDGAVIIRDARIGAAGCVLPLTKSRNLSKDLGMRHRAGIGLSEESDAVVIIVSEETGAISLAVDGMLKRHLNSAALTELLHNELFIDEETKTWKEKMSMTLRRLTKRDSDEEE